MGLRFDLNTANWVAHIISDAGRVPPFQSSASTEVEALRAVCRNLPRSFFSTPGREAHLHALVERLEVELDERGPGASRDVVLALKRFLSHRNWTALLVPSTSRGEVDRLLQSQDFLRRLVLHNTTDRGLILQVEPSADRDDAPVQLGDVFPAFRTALSESHRWPGVLIWRKNESAFFSLPSSVPAAEEAAYWLFTRLATMPGFSGEDLRYEYFTQFPELRPKSPVALIQLSDIHLGCREASMRGSRVHSFVESTLREIGDAEVFLAITGDLLDDPSETNLDHLRTFMQALSALRVEPITLLGNHDVRRNGYLRETLRAAMNIKQPGSVIWNTTRKVGLICFNSVADGRLARGKIGERQLQDAGNALDRGVGTPEDAILLALLHHHPIPVEPPDWYSAPFYQAILGHLFEKTEQLEDAEQFLQFVNARSISAVLHGHKHIPRLHMHQHALIVGCGSSVGKVATTDRAPYMSVNVVTVDPSSRKMSARLLAERVPGGGLTEQRRHECVITAGTRSMRISEQLD